jgi:hypothetical protein
MWRLAPQRAISLAKMRGAGNLNPGSLAGTCDRVNFVLGTEKSKMNRTTQRDLGGVTINDTKAIATYLRNESRCGRTTTLVDGQGRVLFEGLGVCSRRQLWDGYVLKLAKVVNDMPSDFYTAL